MSNRIAPLDGLRTVAVLGVLWTHVWKFTGYLPVDLPIDKLRVDLNRVIAILGNGVDLFFVISGFCMYWMYARKASSFSWGEYVQFLKNRWLRIAPAFYAAATACAIGLWVSKGSFPLYDLSAHFLFLQTTLPQTGNLAAPFWSLAPEWHFYLILPLLVYFASRMPFWLVFVLTMCVSMGFRTWQYLTVFPHESAWSDHLPMRLVEFCWGIGAAYLVNERASIPKLLQGALGFIVACLLAYIGRTLMVHEVFLAAGAYGFICKVVGEPLMALGFALALWNVVSSPSVFTKILSWPLFQRVGRWSYSLYLWHWWPSLWITKIICKWVGYNGLSELLAMLICLVTLVPLSGISYHLLEAPYFNRRKDKASTLAKLAAESPLLPST